MNTRSWSLVLTITPHEGQPVARRIVSMPPSMFGEATRNRRLMESVLLRQPRPHSDVPTSRKG
jgi:hypothetical protein